MEDKEVEASSVELADSDDGDPHISNIPSLCCNLCGVSYSCEIWLGDILAMAGYQDEAEDSIKKIKQKWDLMESGLDIDYRCVKCRECLCVKMLISQRRLH